MWKLVNFLHNTIAGDWSRGSCLEVEVFCTKGVLENVGKFRGKLLCQSPKFIEKEIPVQMFSSEF